MKLARWGEPRAWLAALLFAFTLMLLYAAPYALRIAALPFRGVLPFQGADSYLYLNISQVHPAADGTALNPWYGIAVNAVQSPRFRFGLAFQLLDGLRALSGGDLTNAVLFWQVLVLLGLGLGFYWFFRTSFRGAPLLPIMVAAAFAMLITVSDLPAALAEWFNFLRAGQLPGLELPYARLFFPQFPVLLLLLYLTLQILALREGRLGDWLALCVIQFVGLLAFPYVMPVMAGTSAIAIFFLLIFAPRVIAKTRWLYLALFVGVWAALDGWFLFTGTLTVEGLDAGVAPLFGLRLADLGDYLGMAVLLLICLTVALIVWGRRVKSASPLLLAGLGSTILLLHFSDLIVTPLIQLSHHADHFVNPTLTLMLGYLYLSAVRRWQNSFPRLKWVAPIALGLLLLHGALIAYATPLRNAAQDKSQSLVAQTIRTLALQSDDLILADARTVDDESAWMPLISPAQVLFTRNADLLMNIDDRLHTKPMRFAMYLYLSGKDRLWLAQALAPNVEVTNDQGFLVPADQLLLLAGAERAGVLALTRKALDAELARLENDERTVSEFLSKYHRVVIVDSTDKPIFSGTILARYLDVSERQVVDGYSISVAVPRASSN